MRCIRLAGGSLKIRLRGGRSVGRLRSRFKGWEGRLCDELGWNTYLLNRCVLREEVEKRVRNGSRVSASHAQLSELPGSMQELIDLAMILKDIC